MTSTFSNDVSDSDRPVDWIAAKIGLTISGEHVQVEATVPTGPASSISLLPMFQSVADLIVNLAVKKVEDDGQRISCTKGCGACCRQLVPITEDEAFQLRDLLRRLPEPRRLEILGRFADARQRLQQAGLLDTLLRSDELSGEERRAFGLNYFHLGIPCPFLEQESCSIYADRPIACREYLVTSPAENCANPTPESVQCVKLAARVSTAISNLEDQSSNDAIRWVPLILTPGWTELHERKPPTRTGPELLKAFFGKLTGAEGTR